MKTLKRLNYLPGQIHNMSYKFLEHTADVKFQGFGKTIEEAFVSATEALKETIAENVKVSGKIKKKISIEAKDKEALLYSFLEEFLFWLDAEDFLMKEVKKIKIKGKKLEAEIVGDKASNYKFTNDVKAVTYNEMFVKEDKKGKKFVVQVVLDV